MCLLVGATYSQKRKKYGDYTFGRISQAEVDMTLYEKDSAANAVVLFEQGSTKFNVANQRIVIETTFYKKIKIFNKEGYNSANVEIILYNNDQSEEKLIDIKGITHLGARKLHLTPDKIFKTKLSDNWTKMSFTLPNVQDGSIIEYTYVLRSPFLFNFTGWDFQEDIPKIESVFKASIPGNYVYNRVLVGNLQLAVNHADIKRDCFSPPGVAEEADCEQLTYSMVDIPAFIEEDYMTSKKNFSSRIQFELKKYHSFYGNSIENFTTTWKAVDKEYKNDKDIGGQLRRDDFFKDYIPHDIKQETDVLKKAKMVYEFIRDHYTWNDTYNIFKDSNVKKAFKEKTGSVGEINISLINALKVSDIPTTMVLVSTRDHGYPTKIHPVISDFNYIIAKAEIDGKSYFLDATEQQLPFGMLPFRCLNGDARVMDFKNGSYWETIKPFKNNKEKVSALIELTDDGALNGKVRIINQGYDAYFRRKEIDSRSKNSIVKSFESKSNSFLVDHYDHSNFENKDKPLTEVLELVSEDVDEIGDKIYINPFFIDQITENPFKLKERLYPVDFGHPISYEYNLTLILPHGYKVSAAPKSRVQNLPNNDGGFKYLIRSSDYKINLNFKFQLNNYYFYRNEYELLKELFNQMILAQEEPIVLEKIYAD